MGQIEHSFKTSGRCSENRVSLVDLCVRTCQEKVSQLAALTVSERRIALSDILYLVC